MLALANRVNLALVTDLSSVAPAASSAGLTSRREPCVLAETARPFCAYPTVRSSRNLTPVSK